MLQDVVDTYIAALSTSTSQQGSANHNTVIAYKSDLHQLCLYLSEQGHEDWSQVTSEDIDAYLLEMRESLSYRPTTVARKLAAMKTFFQYLQKSELITTDPTQNIKSPQVQKYLPQILQPEDLNNLFAQVDMHTVGGMRDLAMLHIVAATGMRVSEAISLDIGDFDERHAQVLCAGRNGQQWRDRVLPLPPEAVEATYCYLEKARPKLIRHPEESALFVNHHGERLTRQGFWLIIKGYARQAGITTITPHMLRHSFAMMMLKEGMEIRSVKELLGHAHISTTQIYSQLAQTQMAEDT